MDRVFFKICFAQIVGAFGGNCMAIFVIMMVRIRTVAPPSVPSVPFQLFVCPISVRRILFAIVYAADRLFLSNCQFLCSWNGHRISGNFVTVTDSHKSIILLIVEWIFAERSCIRCCHHMQMVSAGTKGEANVCNIDAILSKTKETLGRRFHGSEHGQLCRRMYSLKRNLLIVWVIFYFCFSDFQNSLFICDAHFHFSELMSFCWSLEAWELRCFKSWSWMQNEFRGVEKNVFDIIKSWN